jgi:hypothetical protein
MSKHVKIKIRKNIILSVVLYGREDLSVILKKKKDSGSLIIGSDELFHLSNTILIIKSRRMRWAEHVASMGEERRGEERNTYRVLVEIYKERDHWEEVGGENLRGG